MRSKTREEMWSIGTEKNKNLKFKSIGERKSCIRIILESRGGKVWMWGIIHSAIWKATNLLTAISRIGKTGKLGRTVIWGKDLWEDNQCKIKGLDLNKLSQSLHPNPGIITSQPGNIHQITTKNSSRKRMTSVPSFNLESSLPIGIQSAEIIKEPSQKRKLQNSTTLKSKQVELLTTSRCIRPDRHRKANIPTVTG